MAKYLVTFFLMALIASCAQSPMRATRPSPTAISQLSTQAGCAAAGGAWLWRSSVFNVQHPGNVPKTGYICNMHTTDSGNACAGPSKCQGSCIAPFWASVGQNATGFCSATVFVRAGTLVVINGRVFNPYPNRSVPQAMPNNSFQRTRCARR
jgi:hypothetical protein